jgi:hypothetical protein
MAVDVGAVMDRLYRDFMAPLVKGGVMKPGRPIGGKTALLMTHDRPFTDPDLVSHVNLARTRAARKLCPVDRLENPTNEEWALSAVLHDLVQSTHPGFDSVLRRSAPGRLLSIVEKTLPGIAPVRSAGEALSRHTWFRRMFEVTRTDIKLSWWTGSQTFLGQDPPGRLTAWPEIRRVHEDKTPRPLMELPAAGGVVDGYRFGAAVAQFLQRTPLTDLATAGRTSPMFAWTPETLSFVSTRAGRTLALRAMAREKPLATDAALGRATRWLFMRKAWKPLGIALDLVGERILGEATARLSHAADEPEPLVLGGTTESDAAFARGAGALAAQRFIATCGECFTENERKNLLTLLGPLADTPAARQIEQLLAT